MTLLQTHWETILLWTGLISVLALVGTLLALPWVVTRLPADYFSHRRRHSWRNASRFMTVNVLLLILRNGLGLILAALGFVLLFTPGQGLLTLLAGLALMNFPGKYRLERRLVSSPGVLHGINWMRARRGVGPMKTPR